MQQAGDSPDILVCRLVAGHVTWVHRRLWPALVRTADHFHAEQLAQIREEHTASGAHVTGSVAFPQWVPAEVSAQAQQLGEREAKLLLGAVIDLAFVPAKRVVRTAPDKRSL